MTILYSAGDGIKGIQIVVLAEKIKKDTNRVKLTSAHTGEKGKARGEAYAYIDIAFQSVPGGRR